MRLRTLVGIAAVMAALVATSTTSTAAAQQRRTTVYRTTQPVVVEQRVVDQRGYEQRGYDQRYVDQGAIDRQSRDPIRFRFGFDATGGAFVRGPEAGFGGLRARLGLQLGDWFALYYMPTGLIGSYMDRTDGDSMAGIMFNSFMAEVTLFDMIQLGVGPSVDFIWGCTDTPQSRLSCDDNGPFFGIDGRVAVALAPHMQGGRSGLTISADIHPTWYADDTVGITVLGGIGVEMF